MSCERPIIHKIYRRHLHTSQYGMQASRIQRAHECDFDLTAAITLSPTYCDRHDQQTMCQCVSQGRGVQILGTILPLPHGRTAFE